MVINGMGSANGDAKTRSSDHDRFGTYLDLAQSTNPTGSNLTRGLRGHNRGSLLPR